MTATKAAAAALVALAAVTAWAVLDCIAFDPRQRRQQDDDSSLAPRHFHYVMSDHAMSDAMVRQINATLHVRRPDAS